MASLIQRVAAAIAAFKGPSRGSVIIPRGSGPQHDRIRSPRQIRRTFAELSSRSYAGAQYDRLTEDFLAPLTTGDAEMRTRIRTLRQRARELERNEPYSRRFLGRLEDNVYDHHGITFRSLAGDWRRIDGKLVFKIDDSDAAIIEEAYERWRRNPYVTKNMDLNEGGRLSLRSVARDGDMFTRPVYGRQWSDGIALQQLEADQCDDYKNEIIREPGNGGKVRRQVRMGVELDEYFTAIAYWILKEHPGDQQWWFSEGYWSERYDAGEFIHPFHRTRITQCRDVTWLCAIMRDLRMLDGYDEAAIVAARTGAAKMGFITRGYNDPGAPFTGEEGFDDSEAGDKAMDAEPGLIEDLSQTPGLNFSAWDPAYPHEQYADFVKARLRRIGAALDTSYYAIANDLTEVNFSSIRAGLLEDRERFKALQTWWINRHERKIFLVWLETALVNGTLRDPVTMVALPFSKLEKFQRHQFRPRRWPWVDPKNDAEASKLAVDNRFKSRSEVIEENSPHTFEKVIREQAAEQELAEELGVELPDPDGDEKEGEENPVDGEGKKPEKANGRKPDAYASNGHAQATPARS